MSILIKGMEMPENCSDCAVRYEMFCPLRHRFIADEGRRKDCPLVPVPEHGRLIDADALDDILADQSEDEYNRTHAPRSWERALSAMRDYLEDAPTIIPAEEGE